MNESNRTELLGIIDHNSKHEGINETVIPGVTFFRATNTETSLPGVYNPSLCFVAQGRKQVMLDKDVYTYGPGEFLIVSVDLPVMGRVTHASKEKPYFIIKVDIDLPMLSELLLHTNHPALNKGTTTRGIFTGKTSEEMGESVIRLARLLNTPNDIPILAQQMKREIYYRALLSDHGDIIAQTALRGSHMQRIASAIEKIKTDFRKTLSIDELANISGMSASSFHAHFKSVTAMSPLQYQKSLRLMEARNLMIVNKQDAATTAHQVGYESAPQFSREYARMFGNPPIRDISILKQTMKEASN
ncbi:MAG: AraC family transcriptional regulator [Alcanivorax sp.]